MVMEDSIIIEELKSTNREMNEGPWHETSLDAILYAQVVSKK